MAALYVIRANWLLCFCWNWIGFWGVIFFLLHSNGLKMARFLAVPNRKSLVIWKGFYFNPLSEWILYWQSPAARRHPIFPLAEGPGASDLHWWERPDTRSSTASSVSSPLPHHVTGCNAWMQEPNGGDLGTGCICKSVTIFLQDRKYARITVWRVLSCWNNMKHFHWNVKEAYCAHLRQGAWYYFH